jgi:hypothetical protein
MHSECVGVVFRMDSKRHRDELELSKHSQECDRGREEECVLLTRGEHMFNTLE